MAMVPAGTVGAFTHWKLGNVVNNILWGLIPGILTGTFLGGNLALYLPERTLRIVFGVVIIGLGRRDVLAARREALYLAVEAVEHAGQP